MDISTITAKDLAAMPLDALNALQRSLVLYLDTPLEQAARQLNWMIIDERRNRAGVLW